MTAKEKAKRYDEAIKVIKGNLDALNEITETGAEAVNIQSIKNCFYRAFPELKERRESEDEKIKKSLINYINAHGNGGDFTKEEYIAWLEKQGGSTLIEEIKRRKELLLREKEKAVLMKEKLSLGGRIAMLEELLAFANERQGEQKPTDKVEPKFKVGDLM